MTIFKLLIFDKFLERQTNLKIMFSALFEKLCYNEEILDGTPKSEKMMSEVHKVLQIYCCINMAAIHYSINNNCI